MTRRETTHFHVLLIEDDASHAELIRRHIERADEHETIQLEHVESLARAVKKLEDGGVDAVLCDLRLPGSEPAETLQAVLHAAGEAPLVVLSSLEYLEFAAQAVKAGAQDFLIKSQLSGPLLLRSIRYAIERKRTELRLKALNESLEREVAKRTRYVKLLQDVAVTANQAANVKEAFQETLDRICTEMNWEIGQALMLKERGAAQAINIGVSHFRDPRQLRGLGDSLLQQDLATRRKLLSRMLVSKYPEFTRNLASDEDLRIIQRFTNVTICSSFAFPVLVRNRIVALFEFYLSQREKPEAEVFEVMAQIGTQIGRVVERRELEHALERLTVEEQRRINSELHDGIGHELSGLAFYANSFQLALRDENSPHAVQATEIVRGIQNALKQLRAVLKGLAATNIAEDALPAALSELAAQVQHRVGVICESHVNAPIALPSVNVATQLYRIAQEAVNNAVKHARASRIDISLEASEEEIMLAVRDDGIGIHSDDGSSDGLGLGIMKHRASLIGGEVEIGRVNGGGTQVRCLIRQETDSDGTTRTY